MVLTANGSQEWTVEHESMLACVMLLLGEKSAMFETLFGVSCCIHLVKMKEAWEQGYSRVLRHRSMNMRTTESIMDILVMMTRK